jgi:hypothetical protein
MMLEILPCYAACRVPKTRGTHNQRLRKTKPTGLAETANETPRSCSDSYEARSTGRLDHVPTRTRLTRQNASTTSTRTGVKSHFLLPIPGWAVKTYHYTHHTRHYSATDHPRGEYDEYRTSRFRGLGLICSLSTHLDPTSTQP